MTQIQRHHANIIALDDYRRAHHHDDDPPPPSFPQAAYPPEPPAVVMALASNTKPVGFWDASHAA